MSTIPTISLLLSLLLPDPTLTPGANDPSVLRPGAVLCPYPNSKAVRDVSEYLKLQVYHRYHLNPVQVKGKDGKYHWNFHVSYCATTEGCEVDHLCSIENGCNNSILNLWVQPYEGDKCNAHKKDELENKLHSMYCAGMISLADDQKTLSGNWIEGYNKYVGPLVCGAE